MTKQKAILLARYVNGVEEEYPKNKPMTKQEIAQEINELKKLVKKSNLKRIKKFEDNLLKLFINGFIIK